jgi:predicted nucleic acid-binding protein
MILVDANVLLRLIQIGHPHQQPALDSIAQLYLRGERFVVCPQVLYEMYAVCTRSVDAANPGLGLMPSAAMAQLEAAERQLRWNPNCPRSSSAGRNL